MAVGSIGKMFLSALLQADGTGAFLRFSFAGPLMKNVEREVYDFVLDHVQKYGALPTFDTVAEHTGEVLPQAKEPPDYYFDKLMQRHADLVMKEAVDQASQKLTAKVPPVEVMRGLIERFQAALLMEDAQQILDFRHAAALVLGDYAAKAEQGNAYGVLTGWPSFDSHSAGVQQGDLVSIVGRPAAGKTWLLLFMALYIWAVLKKRVLFVSMEMKPLAIFQRLASLTASVPHMQVVQAALPKGTSAFQPVDKFEHFKDALYALELAENPLWVVDGNLTATVEDIMVYGQQLRPDVVFVDGAYLLGHPTRGLSIFARVAENVGLLKSQVAGRIAPTICSWQFAREVMKLKKDQKPGLEHIGYSDTIGQHSSIILGLFEPESPETVRRRVVEVLKGRNGEQGRFSIRWDFQSMDFSEPAGEEVEKEAIEDLELL